MASQKLKVLLRSFRPNQAKLFQMPFNHIDRHILSVFLGRVLGTDGPDDESVFDSFEIEWLSKSSLFFEHRENNFKRAFDRCMQLGLLKIEFIVCCRRAFCQFLIDDATVSESQFLAQCLQSGFQLRTNVVRGLARRVGEQELLQDAKLDLELLLWRHVFIDRQGGRVLIRPVDVGQVVCLNELLADGNA